MRARRARPTEAQLADTSRQLWGYLILVAAALVLGYWYPLAVLIVLSIVILWFVMGIMMNLGSILEVLTQYLTGEEP